EERSRLDGLAGEHGARITSGGAAHRLSPLDSREEPNQSDRWAASQSYSEHTSEQGEGPRTAPFPTPCNSVDHCVERLARGVLHFARPGLLDAVGDVLRHRDVIELLGHLGALVIGPSEELERLGSG